MPHVWFVLLYDMRYLSEINLRRSLPAYIVWGAGLQIYKLILVGYNCYMREDKASYSSRPRYSLISKLNMLPCMQRRPDWWAACDLLVSWVIRSGLAHVELWRYRGLYPHTFAHLFFTCQVIHQWWATALWWFILCSNKGIMVTKSFISNPYPTHIY